MTEKRFRISQGYNDQFCHDWEKNKLLNFRQTVDLLNDLVEENGQLKKELHKIKVVNEMLSMDFSNSEHELWKENEQLKSEINMLKTTISRNEAYIERLTHKGEWR